MPFLAAVTPAEQSLIANFSKNWTFWSESNPTHRSLTLPHDAMQTETRQPDMEGGHHSGYFPGGTYHYEKVLNISAPTTKKHVKIHFGGVYRNAAVSVNGQKIATHDYGYTPFDVILDGYLRAGENIIRVDVDNSQMPNSRWYPGAGIYRPLSLNIQDPTHIDEVKIRTLAISPAQINVKTAHNGGTVDIAIFDGTKKIATANGDDVNINISQAKLWSAESPNLYRAVISLKKDGKVVDSQSVDFGVRQIAWNHANGLMVNGKTVKLRGGCIHHDNGIIGSAEFDQAALRKVEIMKQYGFNAIRSSHNPCSESLLRACDKLGMYVLDELADMWYNAKTQFDYGNYFMKDYKSDLQAMVNKDYNHPSVIIYSIGNEQSVNKYKEKKRIGNAGTL